MSHLLDFSVLNIDSYWFIQLKHINTKIIASETHFLGKHPDACPVKKHLNYYSRLEKGVNFKRRGS